MPRRALFSLGLLLSITGISAAEDSNKFLVMSNVLAATRPGDWRALDPENTLYVETAKGRVVIALAPDFAPGTVANVKALARDGYYDGVGINRCQDNRVAAWEYPDEDQARAARKIKHGKSTLPAEFDRTIDPALAFVKMPDGDVYAPEAGFCEEFPAARDPAAGRMWLIHEYGMVGVGRDNAVDSGGGTEIYVVIGQAPRELDRNVTLIGRVVQGIELLSSLPRGTGPLGYYTKPNQYTKIKAIRVAADVPAAQRTNLELMRTDTAAFRDLIESRRFRREEWFAAPTGKIEVANVPLPVRVAGR